MEDETILEEATRLVAGSRQNSYGTPPQSLGKIAAMWSIILDTEVSAAQVALCMAGLKITRQSMQPKRDNLVDAAGYLHIADIIGESLNGKM